MTSVSFDGLQAVAGHVSRETFSLLAEFEQAFQKWAERINLSAPSTLNDTWSRHILDSAQLIRLAPDAKKWVDLGSGGGFPGLVIAFLLMEREGASMDMVESNRKKASFLQAMTGQFNLPARVHATRIEDIYQTVAAPEVITARALAPLPTLLALAEPWLAAGAKALFHKGRDYRAEIKESALTWSCELVEHRSMIDQDGVILEISDLRRLPKA